MIKYRIHINRSMGITINFFLSAVHNKLEKAAFPYPVEGPDREEVKGPEEGNIVVRGNIWFNIEINFIFD
jgi:hypothetical protein